MDSIRRNIAHELSGVALVFVSDIHILNAQDDPARTLLDVIAACTQAAQEKHELKYFVLGGDIFDFLWAGARYFRDKASFLYKALIELHNSGTEVLYVQGNHEFALKALPWNKIKLLPSTGTTLTIGPAARPLRLGICHGDRLIPSSRYALYQSLMHSFFLQKILSPCVFALLPGRWLDAFALKLSSLSRKSHSTYDLDHGKVLSAAYGEAQRRGWDMVLFGHFHAPYGAIKEGEQPVELLSLASWYQGQAHALTLSWDESFHHWSRLTITGHTVTREPVSLQPFSGESL